MNNNLQQCKDEEQAKATQGKARSKQKIKKTLK
jgi:hypothetical protein